MQLLASSSVSSVLNTSAALQAEQEASSLLHSLEERRSEELEALKSRTLARDAAGEHGGGAAERAERAAAGGAGRHAEERTGAGAQRGGGRGTRA